MKKSTIVILAIAGVIVLLILGMVGVRNKMVTMETAVDNSWANVQTSYQRRMDLIPNLVSTVKGYAAHEKSTLTDVTAMRAGQAANVEQAEKQLLDAQAAAAPSATFSPDGQPPVNPQAYAGVDRALGIYVNAVREAYPQLMANENFMDLQKQLESTENRINTERNRYNESVRTYNTYIRKFPQNIVASVSGFDKKQFFQADEAASKAPQVSFEN